MQKIVYTNLLQTIIIDTKMKLVVNGEQKLKALVASMNIVMCESDSAKLTRSSSICKRYMSA